MLNDGGSRPRWCPNKTAHIQLRKVLPQGVESACGGRVTRDSEVSQLSSLKRLMARTIRSGGVCHRRLTRE